MITSQKKKKKRVFNLVRRSSQLFTVIRRNESVTLESWGQGLGILVFGLTLMTTGQKTKLEKGLASCETLGVVVKVNARHNKTFKILEYTCIYL